MKIDFSKGVSEDKVIDSEAAKLSYLSLVVENLRANNRRITRNSFWMTISILLYILVLYEEQSLTEISILFFKVNDSILLLNIIPVFFSYIFLQNVALWNNNINLLTIFEKLTGDVYQLGIVSDTKNILKPFSLTHHVLNYQFNNMRVKGYIKIPLTIILLMLVFLPVSFVAFSIYQITIINTPSFIPIACGIISLFLAIIAVVQAFSVSKN